MVPDKVTLFPLKVTVPKLARYFGAESIQSWAKGFNTGN